VVGAVGGEGGVFCAKAGVAAIAAIDTEDRIKVAIRRMARSSPRVCRINPRQTVMEQR
jgi:hypothetical protein